MADEVQEIDWSKELQNLVGLARTPEEKRAAFSFANAIHPYLENPDLLKTLLGKIMQNPTEAIGVVAAQRDFNSLEDVQRAVGDGVTVVPL